MEKLEKNKLKFYHIFYAIFIIPYCIFISIIPFWSFYSTLTKRKGIYEEFYKRYNLTFEFYVTYNFLISLVVFIFLSFIIKNLYKRNGDKLMNIYWLFLIFVVIFTFCEYLLELRFIPKG